MIFKSIFIFFIISIIASCAATYNPTHSNPATNRTLILNDVELEGNNSQQFLSWKCADFINEGPTIVEVGIFQFTDSTEKDDFGFILFDGTNSGATAVYERRGLERVWRWGNDLKYQFYLQSDGDGFYYNFTFAKKDEKIKASQVFKCRTT